MRQLQGVQEGVYSNHRTESIPEDEEDEWGITIFNDEEWDDSDDEVVSIIGSHDKGLNYHVFNPQVDFKGFIQLTKGSKFPSNVLLRKDVRHHAI